VRRPERPREPYARAPIPRAAPAAAQVWETHSLLARTGGGWVVECRSVNNAPKGDCFFVRVQLCGVRRAAAQSQLRISMQARGAGRGQRRDLRLAGLCLARGPALSRRSPHPRSARHAPPRPQMVFHKACLGRGMITYGAESDAKRSWEALVARLEWHAPAGARGAAAVETGHAGAPPPPPPGGAAAGAAAITGTAPAGIAGGAPQAVPAVPGCSGAAAHTLAAHLAAAARACAGLARAAPRAPPWAPVVLALLAFALAVVWSGQRVASEVRGLAAAVRHAADSLAAAGACGARDGGA
jgi:hypothetical protein